LRYLTLTEVLDLHGRVVEAAGGAAPLRDLGALQSAVAQPRTSFEGAELYPTLEEKATALMFSLVQNHPFVDGNKRVGHAAAESFLMLNGFEIVASVDESERIVVGLAAGKISREELLAWIRGHVQAVKDEGERAT
jgi:death-on-curing protein